MNSHPLVSKVRHALHEGKCIPVVGAGASIPLGGPNWKNYLRKMAEGLPPEFSAAVDDCRSDATELASLLDSERRRLRLHRVPVKLAGFSRIHKSLAAWNCSLYFTTNFDEGLENALRDRGACNLYYNDQLSNLDLTSLSDAPVVAKLCSSSTDQNTGTISREDFAVLLHRERSALELLVTALRTCLVVFVGCSMRDPLISIALDRFYAEGIGRNRHVAFLPSNVADAQRASLDQLGVDIFQFDGIDPTSNLESALRDCGQRGTGQHRLLIFEPSRITKAKQTLEAIRTVSKYASIARIGVVTENPELVDELPKLYAEYCSGLDCDVIFVPSIADSSAVTEAVQAKSTLWTALIAPYEYAVKDAAQFAETWGGPHRLNFHSKQAAILSRDKREFRRFLQRSFSEDPIVPPRFHVLTITPDANAQTILSAIRQWSGGSFQKVVIKPPDAASSIAVRPIDLNDEKHALRVISDFLKILQAMPVQAETVHCDTKEVLVEEFLTGEEFSVESRRVSGHFETLAVHWKVDIDSDGTRFFERLFVTLPSSSKVFQLLSRANSILLNAMNVNDGVFHAEYRVDINCDRVYPLEVGFRPGGGMVTYSVRESRGVDLFEAAVRCALNVPKNDAHSEQIVSTGLVFASRPGILPPLRVKDERLGNLAIRYGDKKSLHQWLKRKTRTANRRLLATKLNETLNRSNQLCDTIKAVMDTSQIGHGTNSDLKLIEVWMQPGAMITEEEASYVAGLLTVANVSQSPENAVADAISSMKLCLDSIECVPEPALSALAWRSVRVNDLPEWWRTCLNGGFKSDIDSWTFSRTILAAVDGNPSTTLLDLGCGSARPAIPAIRQGVTYAGIDKRSRAVYEAKCNLEQFEPATAKVIRADVLTDGWLAEIQQSVERWNIVAANLPYLPCPPDRGLDECVDGGSDGMKFIPDRVLEIAQHVGAEKIILNFSSLCNLPEICYRLLHSGFGVVRVAGTVAPLEQYSLSILSYLQAQSFVNLFREAPNLIQIIYGVEIERNRGIPADVVLEQVQELLRPEQSPVGTMLFGESSW